MASYQHLIAAFKLSVNGLLIRVLIGFSDETKKVTGVGVDAAEN